MGCWSFLCIFFFCETGERVTTAFEEFDFEMKRCSWYTFPIDLQRMLVPVMIYTQRPIIIQGYGNTLCTRFALNTVISLNFELYFLINDKFPKITWEFFRQLKVDFPILWCFDKFLSVKLSTLQRSAFIWKQKSHPETSRQPHTDYLGNGRHDSLV